MVPLEGSERRHRLHGFEVPEVIEGLRLRLWYHLESRTNLLAATVAFRAYYRLIEHRAGRPDYPEPVTWETINDYVNNGSISQVDRAPETLQPEAREVKNID